VRWRSGTIWVAIGVTIIVAVVNVALFSFFPLLHRMFSDVITAQVAPKKSNDVIMEYRKPEKKEEVREERKIQPAAAKMHSAGAEQLSMRFTPDLAVEGTGAAVMEQQELAAAIVEEGETDEPLVPLYRPPLTFSERARELEIEGFLEVLLIVDTEGKVASIEVVRTPHSLITSEARKVISTWRFKPAKNKGVPVRVRLRQVVEFTLE